MRACLEDMAASGGGGGGGGGASVIGLRINPLVGAGAVGLLSVSTRSSKFGVVLPQERGAELVRVRVRVGVRVRVRVGMRVGVRFNVRVMVN